MMHRSRGWARNLIVHSLSLIGLNSLTAGRILLFIAKATPWRWWRLLCSLWATWLLLFTLWGPLINNVTFSIFMIPESGNLVSWRAITDIFLEDIELTKSWIAPVLNSVLTFQVDILIVFPIIFLLVLLIFEHREFVEPGIVWCTVADESRGVPLVVSVGERGMLSPLMAVRLFLFVGGWTMSFLRGRIVSPGRTTSVTERIGTGVLAGYKGWSSRLGWPYQE